MAGPNPPLFRRPYANHPDLPGVQLSPLLSASQASQSDAWTIGEMGIPGVVLMEHAGRELARSIHRHCFADKEPGPAHPVAVVCGPGNNGGDGWVAARHLAEWGHSVFVLAQKPADALKGDAALVAQALMRCADPKKGPGLGLEVHALQAPTDDPTSNAGMSIRNLLEQSGARVIVDALFGTGLSRPITGPAADLVEAINALRQKDPGLKVVAVDLPSGLPTDGAAPLGPCIRADRSVTFGQRKIAHAAEPGFSHCGIVEVVPMGLLLSDALAADVTCFAPPLGQENWPRPAQSGQVHKGIFGHVGVLSGAPQMAGAAMLAARSALRMGAGLVTLITEETQRPQDLPAEIMMRPSPQALNDKDAEALLAGLDAVVVGPGLGGGGKALDRANTLLAVAFKIGLGMVVDADALPLLRTATVKMSTPHPRSRVVATPHPLEAARLADSTAAEVQADRMAALDELSALSFVQGLDLAWVLKGACPVVGDASKTRVILSGAQPVLAVAGSGDVLAGAIAARLAARTNHDRAAMVAAVEGVWAHQEAGARLGSSRGRGVLASEIADALADSSPVLVTP
jgi:NAD(P)H-hydrate epimerase